MVLANADLIDRLGVVVYLSIPAGALFSALLTALLAFLSRRPAPRLEIRKVRMRLPREDYTEVFPDEDGNYTFAVMKGLV